MSWVNYLFCGLGEKSGLVSRLTASTDAEITERISELVTTYTIESNEDTSKPVLFLTVSTIRPKFLSLTEP